MHVFNKQFHAARRNTSAIAPIFAQIAIPSLLLTAPAHAACSPSLTMLKQSILHLAVLMDAVAVRMPSAWVALPAAPVHA